MKAVLQRVKQAHVIVDSETVGSIQKGMLIFLAVGKDDNPEDVDYLVRKIHELRIFEDTKGKMNLSAQEADAAYLVVSQFTLLGNCSKGRRPSFEGAADPQIAEKMYNLFVDKLRSLSGKVETGQFKAMMDVSLINDGPVTFILESRQIDS